MDNIEINQMTEEELKSQQQLQARINKQLDREKLDREKNPDKYKEPLYDCSLGMSKILESISRASLFKDDRRQTFDVFLLNALTIARNCYDKKNSKVDVMRAMKKDVNQFVSYVQGYFQEQKDLIEKPYVIVYLPEYKFKDNYLRPPTEERQKVLDLANYFFKKVCTSPPTVKKIYGGTLYLVKLGSNTFPHKELYHLISHTGDTGVERVMQRRYLLVSHIPMDFHLQNYLSNKLYILESYTGKIKNTSELGKKVFKEDSVPFNQYTHLLLGDNVLIKPLVYRKEKKQILDIAKKNHWNSKPLAVILGDIKRTKLVPIEILTNVKF